MKLAENYEDSPDKDDMKTSSDFLLMSSASCSTSAANHSFSTLVSSALARRASVLDYQKPGTSPLRNGIQCAPADDENVAQTKD